MGKWSTLVVSRSAPSSRVVAGISHPLHAASPGTPPTSRGEIAIPTPSPRFARYSPDFAGTDRYPRPLPRLRRVRTRLRGGEKPPTTLHPLPWRVKIARKGAARRSPTPRRRRMTPAEARERIRARADLNAFISLTDEEGDGPIVAVKDLVDVRGTVTTAGGSLLPGAPAEQDAPLVRRMREFGCVVIG